MSHDTIAPPYLRFRVPHCIIWVRRQNLAYRSHSEKREAVLMVISISIDLAGVAAIVTAIAGILTAIVKIKELNNRR